MKIVIFHIGGGDSDIGSTKGLCDLPGLEVEVFIFEPRQDGMTTRDIPGLRKDIKVTLVPFAIGEVNGQRELFINKHELSSSLYGPSATSEANHIFYSNEIRTWKDNTELDYKQNVEVRTLTSLIEDGFIPMPDVISMDIQGHELAVLRGSIDLLSMHLLALLTESNMTEIYEGQDTFYEQGQFLFDHGFRFVTFFDWQSWYLGPAIGEGFYTVTESLFLKYFIASEGHAPPPVRGARYLSTAEPDTLLKLGLIAFSFKRHSYFYSLFKELEIKHTEYFAKLQLNIEMKFYIDIYLKIKKHIPDYEKNYRYYFQHNELFFLNNPSGLVKSGIYKFLRYFHVRGLLIRILRSLEEKYSVNSIRPS